MNSATKHRLIQVSDHIRRKGIPWVLIAVGALLVGFGVSCVALALQ